VEHVPVLGLILALALGLVSLALVARLPQRDTLRGLTWLPATLLLYNLWVAGFLTADYLQGHVLPRAASPLTPPLVDATTLALLALALAWLYAHVAQIQAFLGMVPAHGTISVARYTPVALGFVLVAGWLLSLWTGYGVLFHRLVSVVGLAVFPAALVASLFFFVESRRLEDVAWRKRLSSLALSYVVLFTLLFVLSIVWGRLAAISHVLPLTLDVILELLYNVVAIVWVTRLTTWLRRTSRIQASPVVAPEPDRAQLLAESGITKREAEIVELICLGKTNQEIADQLFISLTTVKDHNYSTFQKLGVRNRTELTRLVLGAPHTRPK
jgi:DNA-binding CsgD family transcriptional regulator